MSRMEKCIIAAVADNGAIGKGNALLWHIADDMRYFRKTTSGHAVIMGRRTFESIGRPLPKRRNIVLSGTMAPAEDVLVAGSLDEAFALAEGDDACFIIGGAEVYRQAMPLADKLYITEVHVTPTDADVFFPAVPSAIWKEDFRSPVHTDPESGISFEFVTYSRR